MTSLLSALTGRVVSTDAVTGRRRRRRRLAVALIAGFHLVALAFLILTEEGPLAWTLFLGAWAMFNFFFLAVLRRPGVSAVLSLALFVLLIALSWFKSNNFWNTVNFVDLMVIDTETISFLLSKLPHLRIYLGIGAVLAVPALVLLWRLDPFRVSRRIAALACVGCLSVLVGLAIRVPEEPWEAFINNNYWSKFIRSAVTAADAIMTHGVFEADARAALSQRLKTGPAASCQPARKAPHIIMVLDESSFDIRSVPGIKVPPDYGPHFRSFDGTQRSLLVEGSGGPTWFTEYNVLTGLSARSFGPFAYFLTRIAAGHIERGLPVVLSHCGYKTISQYPTFGAFLGAKKFQTSLGIERFMDGAKTGAVFTVAPADRDQYDRALRTIENERGDRPLFLFMYLTANHFFWDFRYRADLTPNWQDPGNGPETDEYIRRQMMSVTDYGAFLAALKRDYPDDSFMIVRYGDHQPGIAARLISPDVDDITIGRQVMANDPRYFTTYYAIDVINFQPVNLSLALSPLDAPYLPLVVLEAAGVPLDPSFEEQKRILERCHGLFYLCANGAEARRFNRLLIDAGLIKGL